MKHNKKSKLSIRVAGLAGAAFVANALGCGDDEDAGSKSKPSGSDKAYAYHVNVYAETGSTTYLSTTPSIEEGTEVDLDTAIPIPGNWGMMGVAGEPTIWLADDESSVIERWTLQDDDTFERRENLDFSGLGLTSAYQATNGFFTPERGAFINNATGKLILWDPTKMELTGELDLKIPDFGNIPAFVRDVVGRPDGTVVASYYYLSDDGYLKGHAGIVTVDKALTKVIGRDEFDGCMYTTEAGQTSDGTLYFSAAGQWVLPNIVFKDEGPYMTQPCTLRIGPGKSAYDRSFGSLDLSALTSGPSFAGTLRIVNDDLAFFVAWHDELIEQKLSAENFSELGYSAPGWKWYSWDLKEDKAREVPGAEAFGGFPGVFKVDGRLFYQDQSLASMNDGFGPAPFYELTSDGVKPAFLGKGFVYGLQRVR